MNRIVDSRMSPSDLEVLLHYYYSPDEHERAKAPAVHDGVLRFLADGLLEPRTEENSPWTSSYQVTERGEKFLEMVLNTPYPEHVWVDPRTRPMSAEEREEQRRSFAYGNVAIHNPSVTRELIDRIADDSHNRDFD